MTTLLEVPGASGEIIPVQASEHETPSSAAARLFVSSRTSSTSTPLVSPSGGARFVRNSLLRLTAIGTAIGTVLAPYSPVGAQTTNSSWTSNVPAAPPRYVAASQTSDNPDLEPIGLPGVFRASEELKEWLALTDTELAELCGVSRRTVLNWRKGGGTHGISSRRLLSIHALVGHLAARLGSISQAMLWLDTADEDGRSRLEKVASGEQGIRRVLRAAEPILFPEVVESRHFDSGLSDEEASSIVAQVAAVQPPSSAPVRRVRNL